MPALKMRRLTSFQAILLGFLLVILPGAALLALPAASKSGRGTPFLDAIFTATSALCVTGLVVRDTATYWSGFGKVVSLLLIQIGGLGVVTIATVFTRLAGKKIGLQLRSVLQESVAAPQIGGIIGYLRWILAVTLTVEAAGAVLILAEYEASGRMVSVKRVTIAADCVNADAATLLRLNALLARCKLMLVDGTTWAPLCAAWERKA